MLESSAKARIVITTIALVAIGSFLLGAVVMDLFHSPAKPACTYDTDECLYTVDGYATNQDSTESKTAERPSSIKSKHTEQ